MMGLQNLKKERIFEIIKKTLMSYPLLSGYSVASQDNHSTKSPTVITYYDTVFESSLLDRWIFFRVEDYYKTQRIIVFINQLNTKKPVNLDLEKYIYGDLSIHKARKEFSFKANSERDLTEALKRCIEFIKNCIDKKMKNIIEGKEWIDSDFDWQGYK